MSNYALTALTSFDEIRLGDRLLVTPNHGRRFGVRIDWVSQGVASGRQMRLTDGALAPSARKILIPGDLRRGTIERIGQAAPVENPQCPDHTSHYDNAAERFGFTSVVPVEYAEAVQAEADAEYAACEGHC